MMMIKKKKKEEEEHYSRRRRRERSGGRERGELTDSVFFSWCFQGLSLNSMKVNMPIHISINMRLYLHIWGVLILYYYLIFFWLGHCFFSASQLGPLFRDSLTAKPRNYLESM